MEREQLGDDAVGNVEDDIRGDPLEAYVADKMLGTAPLEEGDQDPNV